MNKETFMSLIRTLLTSIGVFIIGKNLLGNPIDHSVVEMLIGIAMSLTSVIWSLLDKTIAIEMLQSFIRQVIVGIGGLLLAKGYTTPEKIEAILGVATAVLPLLYSVLSRKKTEAIKSGEVPLSVLK